MRSEHDNILCSAWLSKIFYAVQPATNLRLIFLKNFLLGRKKKKKNWSYAQYKSLTIFIPEDVRIRTQRKEKKSFKTNFYYIQCTMYGVFQRHHKLQINI